MTPLDFDTLLAHYHAEVWEAAAEENGKIAYDEAGVDTAKKLCKGYADLKRQVAALTNERDAWRANAKECSDWGEERRQAALDALEMAMERKDQLAAVQAVTEKLREALAEIRNCNTFKWLCFEKGSPLDLMLVRADVALALPNDDTALQQRLAQVRWNDGFGVLPEPTFEREDDDWKTDNRAGATRAVPLPIRQVYGPDGYGPADAVPALRSTARRGGRRMQTILGGRDRTGNR